NFFVDQETSHVIWLTDERPWIPTKILPDNEWIPWDKLCICHDVKVRPKRRFENCHTRRIVAVLGLNIPVDPWMVFTVHFDKVVIVRPSLLEPARMVEW